MNGGSLLELGGIYAVTHVPPSTVLLQLGDKKTVTKFCPHLEEMLGVSPFSRLGFVIVVVPPGARSPSRIPISEFAELCSRAYHPSATCTKSPSELICPYNPIVTPEFAHIGFPVVFAALTMFGCPASGNSIRIGPP